MAESSKNAVGFSDFVIGIALHSIAELGQILSRFRATSVHTGDGLIQLRPDSAKTRFS